MQQLCLPFLRVASLLKHHLYQYDLPDITATDAECLGLVNYLELVTDARGQTEFNAAMALCFLDGNEKLLPRDWCNQLIEVQPPHEDTRELIFNQHISWQQPRLLGLPREYEQLFTVCRTVCPQQSICCTDIRFLIPVSMIFFPRSIIMRSRACNVIPYQKKVQFACYAVR